MMQRQLEDALAVLRTMPTHLPVMQEAATAIVACLRQGGKVLTAGNGGSAAEAQHLVTELMGRYCADRRSLAAVYLGGDAGMMSCVANDYSFHEAFARTLRGLARPDDVLVAYTTSGNSENILRCLQAARELGVRSLAFLGKGGGRCRGLATWEVVVESVDTARIQEAHQFLLHWLCDQIDEAFPD